MSGEPASVLVELSAALGAGRPDERDEVLRAAAGRVRDGTLRVRAVDEALLQSHLFVGYPAALGALSRWREVGPTPGPAEDPRTTVAERRDRGERLCRAVYGSAYEKLRARVRRMHPAMDRWMVEEGYGRVLAREGLAPAERELCVVALLAAGGSLPQLHSHLRGALRLGADPARVEEALEAGAARADREVARRARERWRRVRARHGERGGTADRPDRADTGADHGSSSS